MSWERDPLWAKSRLYFERAFEQQREDPLFGLLCSFGFELLARAALSSISPTLLAEPDREHKNLLHAIGRGSASPRSLGAAQVFVLCRRLIERFSDADLKAALALINCRNEELHTGAAAFEQYTPSNWQPALYRACVSLSESLGESLETLLGKEEADAATEMLQDIDDGIRKRIKESIYAHRCVFEEKPSEQRDELIAHAKKEGERLSHLRHHRVTCPACACVATLEGRAFGRETVLAGTDQILVEQHVAPTKFSCPGCELKLNGFAELDVAKLGSHYTRHTTQSPQEFYGMVHPEDIDPWEMISEMEEYDND